MCCRLCGYNNDGHDPMCPELVEAGSPEHKLYMAAWNGGHHDGRTGVVSRYDYPATPLEEANQKPVEAVYLLGYSRGLVATEEAESGSRSSAY